MDVTHGKPEKQKMNRYANTFVLLRYLPGYQLHFPLALPGKVYYPGFTA